MNCGHGPKFRNQHSPESYSPVLLLCFLLLPANLPGSSKINEPHFTGRGSTGCTVHLLRTVNSLTLLFCFLLALRPRETCGFTWVWWCTPLMPALGRQEAGQSMPAWSTHQVFRTARAQLCGKLCTQPCTHMIKSYDDHMSLTEANIEDY